MTYLLRFTNHYKEALKFQIEPSGNYCCMPAGATFEIELNGGDGFQGDLIEWEDGWVRLSLDNSAYIKVTHDGVTLMDE